MTHDRWVACLDRLEEHLRRQRAEIESGNGHLVQLFEPDAGLEPLPLRHRDRALALHRENEALVGLLSAARDEAGADVGRADTRAPSGATYLDTRA